MHSKKPTDPLVAARPAPIRFLRLPDVMSRTGLGADSVYRLAREGRFPKAVKISDRASGWVESEVDDFIKARIEARLKK